MAVFVDVRGHAELLAGEHLVHHRLGEVRDAAVLQVQGPDVAVEGVDFFVGEQAAAAVLAEVEGDAVFLVLRGEEPHAHAVLEGEGPGAVDAGLDLGVLAALERGGVEEGLGDILGCGLLDLGVLHGVDDGAELLHGRVREAFLLGRLVDDHQVLAGDQLLGQLVDDLGRKLLEQHLDELVLRGRIHERLVVEEVVDHRHHELGVRARGGLVGGRLILGKDLGLGAPSRPRAGPRRRRTGRRRPCRPPGR